jgi:hypothetical protein
MSSPPDPFNLSEEDKIIIVLARVLYLKNVIHRNERPNADPLHTGTPVFKNTARTAISLLGYGDGVLEDLLAESALLYDAALKNHESTHNTAA